MGAGRSMSFIGTVGVIAQQGNNAAAVAPTSVSVATSSSGNYDDAFQTHMYGDGSYQSAIHFQAGSVFSSNSGETQLNITALDNFTADSSIKIYIGAYLRATGATSYSWTLASLTSSLSIPGSFTPALVTSSYNTQQDNTYSSETDGIGAYVNIASGGGRGGLTWGNANDYIEFDVKATATNSAGNTNSDTIHLKIVWTAGDSGD
jgi:hypothetical protein